MTQPLSQHTKQHYVYCDTLCECYIISHNLSWKTGRQADNTWQRARWAGVPTPQLCTGLTDLWSHIYQQTGCCNTAHNTNFMSYYFWYHLRSLQAPHAGRKAKLENVECPSCSHGPRTRENHTSEDISRATLEAEDKAPKTIPHMPIFHPYIFQHREHIDAPCGQNCGTYSNHQSG